MVTEQEGDPLLDAPIGPPQSAASFHLATLFCITECIRESMIVSICAAIAVVEGVVTFAHTSKHIRVARVITRPCSKK